MATAAQRALAVLKDPLAATDPSAAQYLDDAIDLAITETSRPQFGALFDLVVALKACMTLRRRNPNVGGGTLTSVSESAGGSRGKNGTNMPPGFPAHWYSCPAGEELIGILQGVTPPVTG